MESTENKITTLGDLLEFFTCEISSCGSGVNSLYGKAVRSLCSFVGDDRSGGIDRLVDILPSWLVSLRLRDVSLGTAQEYLKSLSGLYSRAVRRGVVPSTELFSRLRILLRHQGEALWLSGINRSDYSRFHNFVTSELGSGSESASFLVLLSYFGGGIPVVEVAKWRKSSLPMLDSVSLSIVERQLPHSSRDYLFSLSQSKRTPRQLERYVSDMIESLFCRYGLRYFGSVDSTLQSYWLYSALRSGCRASEIQPFMVSVPAGLPVLGLCPADSSDSSVSVSVKSVRQSVVSQYSSVSARWYAMRLRPRVSYEDLTARLSGVGEGVVVPELFYPCREIAKRVGRKIVFSSEPFISQVVFFRMRYSDISTLFGAIGDLAWCYRSGSGSDSVYSAISESSFSAFQQAIGRFTPELLHSPGPEVSLCSGDNVVILGGNCDSQRGEIIKMESGGVDGIVTYLVRICNRLTSNFTVRVSPRQLRKVSGDLSPAQS